MEKLIEQLVKEIAVQNKLTAIQIVFQNSYYFLGERKPAFETEFEEYIKRVLNIADNLKHHLSSTLDNIS